MPFLLARCPGFEPRWAEHVKWWRGEEAGIYNDLGAFSEFVIEAFERGETDVVVAAFDAIEQLLRDGDKAVQQITAIDPLETIRNIASHRSYGKQALVKYLGPLSAQAWAHIEDTWRGKHSLADVVRAEVRAAKKKLD